MAPAGWDSRTAQIPIFYTKTQGCYPLPSATSRLENRWPWWITGLPQLLRYLTTGHERNVEFTKDFPETARVIFEF